MNPEPLTKEKIERVMELMVCLKPEDKEITEELFEKKMVNVKYIKSAVNWLLKEIEKEYEEEFKKNPQIKDFKDLNTYSYAKGFWNGVTYGLSFAIQKIKKAFSGVIEE